MDSQYIYIVLSKYTYYLSVQEVCILPGKFRKSVKLAS